MGINLSEREWCRKATPEVPCKTQGFSHCADSTKEHDKNIEFWRVCVRACVVCLCVFFDWQSFSEGPDVCDSFLFMKICEYVYIYNIQI